MFEGTFLERWPNPKFDDLTTSFNKAKEAAVEGNLCTLENCFDTAFRVLEDIKTALLFICVFTYLKHGEFRKARTAAHLLQKTSMGKEQHDRLITVLMHEKRYWDVIEMCDIRDLYKVGRKTKEGWRGDPELRQQAIDKLEKYRQIDVIKNLPHEIVAVILDQLDFIDIINCMYVSKDWRQRICDDSSARNRQHVILDYETREKVGSFSKEFYRTPIKLLADGVKSLKIDKFSSYGEPAADIRDMFTSVSFNHLRVLNIVRSQPCYSVVRSLLKGSSHSLEEVYFEISEFTPSEILDICPHLKRLHCQVFILPRKQESQTRSQSKSPYLSLEYLDIGSRLPREDILEVLERAVNLQEIASDSRDDDILRLIHQYGSKQLRHICFNKSYFTDGYPKIVYDDIDTFSDMSYFDYKIDVHHYGLQAASVLQLLNHNANMKEKIKAISFTLGCESLSKDWSSFKDFTLPCLRLLRFSFTQKMEEIFATVIRNCPTLEEVSISRLLCPPSNTTIDALKTLRALKCFAIENTFDDLYGDEYFVPYCIMDVDDAIIRQFFTYHVLLGDHSTLQQVRLRHISDLEPATFQTLFKIKSLKTLNVAGCDLLSNAQKFGSVIDGTNGSSLPVQLENLVLDVVLDITDYDLQFLDLPTIKLLSMSTLTPAGVKGMLQNAANLKKVVVWTTSWAKLVSEVAELKDVAKKANIQLEFPT